MTVTPPRCADPECRVMLYEATRHTVADVDYCAQHCPSGCAPDDRFVRAFAPVEPCAVERFKRGHRRGLPRKWSQIGRGS